MILIQKYGYKFQWRTIAGNAGSANLKLISQDQEVKSLQVHGNELANVQAEQFPEDLAVVGYAKLLRTLGTQAELRRHSDTTLRVR